MVFSSPTFLFLFFPVVFLFNVLLPARFRNTWLLLASLLFYGWGEPLFVLVMILSALFNFTVALGIDKKNQQERSTRLLMVLAVSFNIGLLVVLKYLDFVISILNSLLRLDIPLAGIPLPIGISFFTFQALSYVIDVCRRQTPAQRNFKNLLLYISFFPQLIAGPIVRYHDVAEQISHRPITLEKTASGLLRFTVGLAKKVLIANYFGLIADKVYALDTGELGIAVSWFGAVAYMIQIYFDFSGYSDMAIGLGRIFGFHFKENFLYPYAAAGLKDFWNRWHVSLSTWFKEYLYIPLGGNRHGRFRTAFNKIIVFFLTGLWHGASWTFVIWGLVHGLFLLLEDLKIIPVDRLWKPLRHIYTMLVVLLTFVLFRSETFSQAAAMLKAMFTGFSAVSSSASILLTELLTVPFLMFLVLSVILSLPVIPWLRQHLAGRENSTSLLALRYVGAALIFVICLFSLSTSGYNPFIYFRF